VVFNFSVFNVNFMWSCVYFSPLLRIIYMIKVHLSMLCRRFYTNLCLIDSLIN